MLQGIRAQHTIGVEEQDVLLGRGYQPGLMRLLDEEKDVRLVTWTPDS